MANNLQRGASPEPLSNLLLDSNNPRFGGQQTGLDQTAVLDHIVENYGIDDVISSLAVNGYFKAEPLVGRREGDKIVIVEGNRRLAACLILASEERARNQGAKSHFKSMWEKHGKKTVDPVPVIIFEDNESGAELISYLGVRHISASSPWDSYAKAHWAAEAVKKTSLTVSDISTMIGDPHRTVARLLEGYYLVEQAKQAGYFEPTDSVRKGRGSVTEFPFSWVYTILGYAAARQYLELADNGPVKDPVPKEALPKVKTVLAAMFGSRSTGHNAVIQDSRALGDLASALVNEEKIELIKKGIPLEEVNRLTRPLSERVKANLTEIRRLQGELLSALGELTVSESLAKDNHPMALANRRAASSIEKTFRGVLFPDENDA